MNSYQRVMNTLSGQPVERLPFFAVLGTYSEKLTGTDLRTHFSEVAYGLMCDNRGVLVYLDTGLTPVPEQEPIQFSACCGLPWRVEAVSLENMLAALPEAQTGVKMSADSGVLT